MTTRCFSPPAQRHERSLLERGGPGGGERRAGECDVLRAFDLERAEVGVAAHERDLVHRIVEGELGLLRDDRHAARQHPTRDRLDVASVELDPSRDRTEQAAEETQQRRLSGPVRAEDADQAARREVERDLLQDGAVAVGEGDLSGS